MVTNQILQATIDGLRNITCRELSVIERDGKVVAATDGMELVDQTEYMESFVSSPAESQFILGYHHFKVFDNGVVEYIVIVKGEDDDAYRIGKIAAFQIQSLIVAYKERYDKDNFIKNLLLDNLLLVDIYNRAKKLHIENNVPRIAYLIQTEIDREAHIVEILRELFPSKTKDFIVVINDKSVILVKELRDKDATDDIERTARMVYDTLSAEAMSKVMVGIGSVVFDLKNVSNSYKEATMALEVGEIFGADQNIINYQQLGIGRLIYQLPTPLCKMFMNEVLHDVDISQLDDEILITANEFFKNNLNVSETSRQLYIHRNTLVYRLDKLQKITGLDLRRFDDAIVFKIALMVSKYMNFKDNLLF
ncbi:MAG: helix-turn-helix domain-containing protein [Clostridiales bacterium]|jgi:carbohydrate diacid regulator|nr:helix-turn-helix domain-containing protein [Clostridiales bacterium]